jgi:hypothetical protein
MILWRTGLESSDKWQPVSPTSIILPIIGISCICLGLGLMIATIRLFATVGKGTLAPWETLSDSLSEASIATSAIR